MSNSNNTIGEKSTSWLQKYNYKGVRVKIYKHSVVINDVVWYLNEPPTPTRVNTLIDSISESVKIQMKESVKKAMVEGITLEIKKLFKDI